MRRYEKKTNEVFKWKLFRYFQLLFQVFVRSLPVLFDLQFLRWNLFTLRWNFWDCLKAGMRYLRELFCNKKCKSPNCFGYISSGTFDNRFNLSLNVLKEKPKKPHDKFFFDKIFNLFASVSKPLLTWNLDQFPFLVWKVHISCLLSKSKYWKQFFVRKKNHNYQFRFINKIKPRSGNQFVVEFFSVQDKTVR